MYKSLVALAFVVALAGCAGTTGTAATAAAECKIVNQDSTDSHIKVRRECNPPAEEQGPANKQSQAGAD